MPKYATKPSVIAISSHVVRGSVGNRAAVFAFETLGFPVWSVPTVTLPWHPGHGPATRMVPDGERFSDLIGDLESAPWLGEVGGILSGYLGIAQQAGAISGLIEAARRQNPDLIYVCDPVIGDNGGLYVPEETAMAVRDRLLPLADIATPNRFELEWLAGKTVDDTTALAEMLGPSAVLVTSAFVGDNTGNLLVTDNGHYGVRHPAIADPPNGMGDLTAALYLAHKLDGKSDEDAVKCATCSVFALLQRSKARSADELSLATDRDCIIDPPRNLTVIDE